MGPLMAPRQAPTTSADGGLPSVEKGDALTHSTGAGKRRNPAVAGTQGTDFELTIYKREEIKC
jgi:hypothetical protein